MSSTRTNTSTGTTSNTFTRMPGASSPDIDRLRNQEFQVDPTIAHRAGASRNRLNASFMNPAGGYATPQILDARRNSANREMDERQGMEARAGQFDLNQQNFQRNSFLAGLTAPPLVQSGSTSTGTDRFKTPFSAKIMPALQSGAQTAAAGLSGG